MKPKDLIFNEIYRKSLSGGACERSAKDYAVKGMNDYDKGKFKTVNELVNRMIVLAKKATPK